jgi:hypothetical protein
VTSVTQQPDNLFQFLLAQTRDVAQVLDLAREKQHEMTSADVIAWQARLDQLGQVNEIMTDADVRLEARRLRVRDEAKRLVAAESAPTPEQLDAQYLNVEQLAALPQPEPLIAGVLSRHAYAILRGRDGTYKSFVALDWALSLASGRPWQGRETEQCKVLYVAGEGAYGLHKRVEAWTTAWRPQKRLLFDVRITAPNLYRGGPDIDDLIERVRDNGYGLVVLDTLRRVSGGADGNSSDMGVVVDTIDRIRQATDHGTALVISHTAKDDGDTRGFSGIEDDADIVWHSKRGDPGRLTLTNGKMKDATDGATIDLQTRVIGESLIIESADPAATDRPGEGDPAASVLSVIRATFAETGATIAELKATTGIPQTSLYRARGELIKAGQVVIRGARMHLAHG